MKSDRSHAWVGWVLPIVFGTAAGLGTRALSSGSVVARLQAADPAQPTPRPETGSDQHASASRSLDARRVAPVSSDPGPESHESLEDVLAEITLLEQRIDELSDGVFFGTHDDGEGWFEPDEDTLAQWAACAQLPVDMPSALFRGGGSWFSEQALEHVNATEDEIEALAGATDQFGRDLHQRIVALHDEIVGTGAVENRPTHALISDLRAMQAVSDPEGLDRKLVALERAGQPPPEAIGSQEMVPFYRELIRLGDDLQQRVASVLGKERARALRRHGNGWGARLSNPPSCE